MRCWNDDDCDWPDNSATNRAKPIPMGARAGVLFFSAARRRMAMTSSNVKIISMKRPWTTEVPPPRDVCTEKGPGKRTDTIADARVAASICATVTRAPLAHGRAPMRHIASETYLLFSRLPLVPESLMYELQDWIIPRWLDEISMHLLPMRTQSITQCTAIDLDYCHLVRARSNVRRLQPGCLTKLWREIETCRRIPHSIRSSDDGRFPSFVRQKVSLWKSFDFFNDYVGDLILDQCLESKDL